MRTKNSPFQMPAKSDSGTQQRNFLIVNGITLYRLVAAPFLVWMIFSDEYNIFKWMLAVSFFTDMIDGYLARRLKVNSMFGSKIDSISDDLTMLAGIIGAVVFKREFVREQSEILLAGLVLLILQNLIALIKYHKISSFHTYSAKAAALLQGTFLILLFLLPEPILPLFWLATIATFIDLIEETILVLMLPNWENDVKGIYWVIKKRKKSYEPPLNR